MGVINFTPDSFSDGNTYFSQNFDSLLSQLKDLKAQGVSLPDVGAQSTAPSATPINEKDEYLRLSKHLLPLIERKLWPWEFLSLDTYRVSTASAIFKKWRSSYPLGDFYFNDVSGVLDDELAEFLLSDAVLSCAEKIHYIFTSSFIEVREQTPGHLQFAQKNLSGIELASLIHKDWERVIQWWQQKGIKAKLILDPGFGFSKTREQNLFLLNNPKAWMPKDHEHQVLWGISRKSFLRPPGLTLKDHPEILPTIEANHQNLSAILFQAFPNHSFIWRLHDPKLSRAMSFSLS